MNLALLKTHKANERVRTTLGDCFEGPTCTMDATKPDPPAEYMTQMGGKMFRIAARMFAAWLRDESKRTQLLQSVDGHECTEVWAVAPNEFVAQADDGTNHIPTITPLSVPRWEECADSGSDCGDDAESADDVRAAENFLAITMASAHGENHRVLKNGGTLDDLVRSN